MINTQNMNRLLLLTVIALCVGCSSKSLSKPPQEKIDSLTAEELLEQHVKNFVDSTVRARDYYKRNLGQFLAEWEQAIKQSIPKLSTFSERKQLQSLYSFLEYSASVSAWNKHQIAQGYDVPDIVIKEDALRDAERMKNQLTYFPSIRLLFARVCKDAYWIDDIDVKIGGNRNQYIHFIGAQFSANRNIKAFHDDFGFTFEVLRFKQVRYSWYDGGKYTYFNIYDGKDSDPIPTILEGVYWWGAFPNTF